MACRLSCLAVDEALVVPDKGWGKAGLYNRSWCRGWGTGSTQQVQQQLSGPIPMAYLLTCTTGAFVLCHAPRQKSCCRRFFLPPTNAQMSMKCPWNAMKRP